MKQRLEGRVTASHYEVIAQDGAVVRQIPLADAIDDPRLAAAIRRNGWQKLEK